MRAFLSSLAWVAVTVVVSVVAAELACRVIYTRKLDYQIEMSRYAAALKRSVGAVYMLRARAHRRLCQIMGSASDYLSDSS